MSVDGKSYSFSFNGTVVFVSLPRLSTGQIRALTATPAYFELIIEGAGTDVDRLLTDGEKIDLTAGPVSVFSRPPTSFGTRPPRR